MCSCQLLRYRKYLISTEMILLCLIGIISSIQASIIDVPDTADSVRGKAVFSATSKVTLYISADSVRGAIVYTLYTGKKSWKEARKVCRNNGGYLINIETEAKYQLYISMKTSVFASDIGTPWTGLHWRSSTSRHWDGPGCPPPEAHMSASDHWRSSGDFNYDSGDRCYREKDNGFESRDCGEDNTFICEHYKDGTCSYDDSTITSFSYRGGTSPTLDECKTNCDGSPGCFLTGNVDNACLMLVATDAGNSTIAIKKCPSENAIDRTSHNVGNDNSDPTNCVASPSVSSLSTCTTVTSTETSTATETFTETSTDTTTDTYTETSTETTTDTYTEHSTMTETSTTTSVSTHTETTTETITIAPGVPPVATAVQTVGNIITTVLQISTVTIAGSSLVVSTVTETQTQSCDTVTIDVTGSCSSTVLYSSSPCPSETDQSVDTTIQSSFSSVQINDTSASSSTGIQGVIGSDGIMRSEVCREVIVVTPDPVAEQAAVESIVNELTVDKKNISAVVQKKVSAQDKRSSSVAIGYMGIAFLILPLVLIIAVDIPTCIQGGRDVIKLCKDEDRF